MSGKKEKKLKIVDHRHCRVCGKAVPPNQEFCSEACRKAYEDARSREKRMRNILLLVYALMFIFIFLLIALRGAAS